ncbi:TonB-dependent siderophore receptor [Yoonia sp. BS5-3]|uniref:TonB-dependent siderophore receptor n=1 Tax=Yoonia phaeophyticola TaxID=3137369 RepID=A0ABZ2V762_9RHOB
MSKFLDLKLALAASTCLVPVGALAQTTDETGDVFLGTIVLQAINDGGEAVTGVEAANTAGSRLPVNPEDLPRSVTILPSELFEAQGARTLEEAASYSPGISTETYGRDDRYDEFSLRGFEVQQSGKYRDALPLRAVDFAAWRTETFGLESINILRGPTSDLYGANQPGGLINGVSKRPEFTQGGEARLTTKSDGGGEVAVDTTGPVSDAVAYRLVALFNQFGTNYDEVETGRIYIAPSLTYEASDDTSVTFYGQYQEDQVGDVYINVPEYGSYQDNANGTWDRDLYTANPDANDIETQQNYVGYELEHYFTNQLSLISRARASQNDWDMDTEYATAFVNISYILGAPVGDPSDVDTGIMTKFTVDQTTEQFSADNALSYEFSTANVDGQIIAGVDHFTLSSDIDSSLGYTGERNLLTGEVTTYLAGSLPTDLPNSRQVELQQTGVYLNGRADFGGQAVLSGGIRQDFVDYEIDGFNTGLDTTVTEFGYEIEDSVTSANLALGYRVTPDVLAYGAVSNSFSLPLDGVTEDGSALEVERGLSFEAGLKFASANGATATNIAYFDITKSDVLVTDQTDTRFVEQIGEVRSKGLEIEVTHDFGNGLSLFGSATYTDAEVTEDTFYEGNDVARVPEFAAGLFAQYELQQIDGLSVGLGLRHSGERFSDAANTYEMEAVTLVDGSISYGVDDWTFTAAARNLADKEYVGYCHANPALFGNALDSFSGGCVYGEGREISLTARRTF